LESKKNKVSTEFKIYSKDDKKRDALLINHESEKKREKRYIVLMLAFM
jgi:hypothetical protein